MKKLQPQPVVKELIKMVKQTYCRLCASKHHGVGVVAIRNIPKGANIFYGAIKHRGHKVKLSEFKGMDREIFKMLEDFLVIDKNKQVLLPDYGLNGMDISFFLNRSSKPNVKTTDGGETFVTSRNVKKGEELTVDYQTYDWN